MTLTSAPPGCSSRMATPRPSWLTMVIAVAALWSTPAISSLQGEDSVIRFVGPADRMQPPSANEVMTSIDLCTTKNQGPKREVRDIASLLAAGPVASKTGSTTSSNTSPTSRPLSPLDLAPQHFALPPLPKLHITLESIFKQAANHPLMVANRQETDGPAQLPAPDENAEEVTSVLEQDISARCQTGPALADLSTDISLPAGSLPADIAALCASAQSPIVDQRSQGGWAMTRHHWSATGMRHRPLYFEEINAERYGYTASYCLQPVISAGRFFLTIPALPYKMAVQCPRSCVYTLGYYRPGSCVPRRWHRLPLKATGAVAQVGVVAGLILLIP